ncbi:Cell division protein FtsQ (modular protein) [uncultured Alphaproteobacteria bacterium]|uniref:Cell division protein FtsQ n=1 Tax=uncultured Alphaproteobacteria bacterium TaxID=91750 RepID=A0A212JKH3_9PROT|nr:Cell division protein FtsQ (modular protein) [uncultured Alphaproteobacteria bacterium]
MRRLNPGSEPSLSAAPWAREPAAAPREPILAADYGGAADDAGTPALAAEPRAPKRPAAREPVLAADYGDAEADAGTPAFAAEPRAPKRRAAPRRTPQPQKRGGSRLSRRAAMWKKRLGIAALAAAVSALAAAAAIGLASDRPAQVWRETRADVLDWTARNGLVVSDIQAVGRRNTSGADLLDALGVSARTPILGLDLVDAKRRIESLPWVASAEIERRLPHALRIVITERVPVAILQTSDRSMLIDAKGVQIVPVAAQPGNLPIVTGRGAAENAAALIAELARFPEIGARVKAAVRVGDRRWDIRLDSVESGVEVRLPEIDAAAAIGRLAELDRKHRLLERDVALIDLRMPDRMVVRLADGKTLPTPNFAQPQKGHSA